MLSVPSFSYFISVLQIKIMSAFSYIILTIVAASTLSAGANVNAMQPGKNFTALMYASSNGYYNIVELL